MYFICTEAYIKSAPNAKVLNLYFAFICVQIMLYSIEQRIFIVEYVRTYSFINDLKQTVKPYFAFEADLRFYMPLYIFVYFNLYFFLFFKRFSYYVKI